MSKNSLVTNCPSTTTTTTSLPSCSSLLPTRLPLRLRTTVAEEAAEPQRRLPRHHHLHLIIPRPEEELGTLTAPPHPDIPLRDVPKVPRAPPLTKAVLGRIGDHLGAEVEVMREVESRKRRNENGQDHGAGIVVAANPLSITTKTEKEIIDLGLERKSITKAKSDPDPEKDREIAMATERSKFVLTSGII